MSNGSAAENPSSLWNVILTDVHFWVPAIVLAAGLALLHWIQ